MFSSRSAPLWKAVLSKHGMLQRGAASVGTTEKKAAAPPLPVLGRAFVVTAADPLPVCCSTSIRTVAHAAKKETHHEPSEWKTVAPDESAALLQTLARHADDMRAEVLQQKRTAEYHRAKMRFAHHTYNLLHRKPKQCYADAELLLWRDQFVLPAGPALPVPPRAAQGEPPSTASFATPP